MFFEQMTACAKQVMKDLPDILLAYGQVPML
jgi:hypothetical protein